MARSANFELSVQCLLLLWLGSDIISYARLILFFTDHAVTSGVRQGCVLAPALFCIAMDWILNRCTESMGVTVGSTRFTDQAYADDGVLFTDCPSKWPEILTTFDAAETMGLHTSWQKTKIQNIGHGTPPSSVYMQASGQTVEAVYQFLYLGSAINSDG